MQVTRRESRRSPRLGLVLAAAALCGAPSLARAQDPASAATPAAKGDGRRTLRRLPANLGRGAVGVFHQDNLVPFVFGGAAVGLASTWDEDLRDKTSEGWSEDLETAGGGVWSSAFVATMFTVGRFSKGTRFRAMTYDMLDATIVNYGYTSLLKVAVGRERPNGEDNHSFPSGHSSNAFALAAVAERHYGWKVGVPSYLVAGVVGASRIQQNKHYLSDVVAGATLGYIVGRTVVRVNDRPLREGGLAVTVAPVLGPSARGLQVAVRF